MPDIPAHQICLQTEGDARLSANENPLGPSPMAIAAAWEALGDANRYPGRGDDALCHALARFHGAGLGPGNFFAANGGTEVLSLIEDTHINPGQRAIICPPCFGPYATSLQRKGAVIDRVWLDDDFAPDIGGILSAVTSDTRLLYLCNPNNPTGTWFGQEVLETILDQLPGHVTLIYDEVYHQFATKEPLPDARRFVSAGRNIVIVHSFSKAYGLAGLRIGYGIANAATVERIQKAKRSFHVSSAALAAAIAALDDETHLRRTIDNNHAERLRLEKALGDLGLGTWPSQANFLLFGCPPHLSARDLSIALKRAGVSIRPAFDLADHVRVTIGQPPENDRLLRALRAILAEGA